MTDWFPFQLPIGLRDDSGRLVRNGLLRLPTVDDELRAAATADVAANPRSLELHVFARVVGRLGDQELPGAAVLRRLYRADFEALVRRVASIEHALAEGADVPLPWDELGAVREADADAGEPWLPLPSDDGAEARSAEWGDGPRRREARRGEGDEPRRAEARRGAWRDEPRRAEARHGSVTRGALGGEALERGVEEARSADERGADRARATRLPVPPRDEQERWGAPAERSTDSQRRDGLLGTGPGDRPAALVSPGSPACPAHRNSRARGRRHDAPHGVKGGS